MMHRNPSKLFPTQLFAQAFGAVKPCPSCLALLAAGLAAVVGCGEKPTPPPQAAAPVPPTVTMEKPAPKAETAEKDHDHDHDHDHELPETIEEAIASLKEIGVKVEKAIASGSTDVADDMVHSVGHLIEDLQDKIAAAKLGEKAQAAAQAATDEIYDAYGAIDEALHAAEEEVKTFDFKQFTPKIKAATKTLEDMFLKAKQTLVGEEPTGQDASEKAEPKAEPKPPAEDDQPKPAATPAGEAAPADDAGAEKAE